MLLWYYGDDELLMYGSIDLIMQRCDDGVILYNGVNYIIMSLGDVHCRVYTWIPCIQESIWRRVI